MEERKAAGEPGPTYTVRPLFFASPQRSGEVLSRTMTKLARDLRERLDGLAKEICQDELAAWTFCPAVEQRRLQVEAPLRRVTLRAKVSVVSFEALGRRLAFVPQVPGLWFDVERGQSVAGRATEVITEHFLKLEKKDGDEFVIPAELTEHASSWVSEIELDVHPAPELPKADLGQLLAALGAEGKMSGRAELHKVGRCLDWLFPDELDRAVLREDEVGELLRRLEDTDQRPVLLLGPPKSGKTTVIHECVYRRVEKRTSPHVTKRNVWLLSPQRLISGMMYVGQWEERLLAIIAEAKEREHVLYFDDVLGLYHAGVSASSDLAVAHVLRPYVERREFRMLAEMTSEQFRVLQEQDRAFADLFQVLPVPEVSEQQARKVLVTSMRQLEDRYRCLYDLEVLPASMDLQQRYVRDMALPGKTAVFLRDLAVKHRGSAVTRQTVMEDFHARSGLSVSFLDGTAKLERKEVIEAIGKQVVGQEGAVGAMADVVCIAKARLNDPTRPLATFLFLGPMGVGKTQCAKALAEYLFGDAERLVRLDMNEFVDGYSVARLVGTFREPEGLLTSAVRRQPFSVVLLDEIEKADPAVFDLLLQVLGEGRLTDARGRTADFTNAIIVMTSNLGVREAAGGFGLKPNDAADDEVYVSAAERFFRPEFFNRIDRVVPFQRLTREHVTRIAHQLIADVFKREGLVHRRSVLEVEERAMERIVEAGFHPRLGARALKRAIERKLTQPVARRLAVLPAGSPGVIGVFAAGDELVVRVDPIVNAARIEQPVVDLSDGLDVLDRVEDAVARIEEELEAVLPEKRLMQGQMGDREWLYLSFREQAMRIRRLVQSLDRQITAKRRPGSVGRPAVRPVRKTKLIRPDRDPFDWKELLAAESLRSELAEVLSPEEEDEGAEAAGVRHGLELATQWVTLLGVMSAGFASAAVERVMLLMRCVPEVHGEAVTRLREHYQGVVLELHGTYQTAKQLGLEGQRAAGTDFLVVEMPAARALFEGEQGTHLFSGRKEGTVLVQVIAAQMAEGETAEAALRRRSEERRKWREELGAGAAGAEGDPWRVRPVVRLCDEGENVVADFRTGTVFEGRLGYEALLRLMANRLRPPEELTSLD